jgi:hypothetical protein
MSAARAENEAERKLSLFLDCGNLCREPPEPLYLSQNFPLNGISPEVKPVKFSDDPVYCRSTPPA